MVDESPSVFNQGPQLATQNLANFASAAQMPATIQQPYLANQQAQANIGLIGAQQQQTQDTAQQIQLQNLYAKHNLEGQLLQNLTPENYQQTLAIGTKSGLDISNAPAQYDPNWVQAMQKQWVNADQNLHAYSANVPAVQAGLTPYNPANPSATVQPSFGAGGIPAQSQPGALQATTLANSAAIAQSKQVDQNLNQALALLGTGKAYGGMGAPAQMLNDRAAMAIGNPQIMATLHSDPESFHNTQQINQLLNDNALADIKGRVAESYDKGSAQYKLLTGRDGASLQDLTLQDQKSLIQTIKSNFDADIQSKQQINDAISHSTLAEKSSQGDLGVAVPNQTSPDSKAVAAPNKGLQNPVIVKTKAQADALPPGTVFIGPSGKLKVR